MIYTTHGAMTPADLEEYRQDTDWYELNPPAPTDDGCVHGRLLTDDCDACERPTIVWVLMKGEDGEGGHVHGVYADRAQALGDLVNLGSEVETQARRVDDSCRLQEPHIADDGAVRVRCGCDWLTLEPHEVQGSPSTGGSR